MISLLARLFIKPDPAREEPETRRAYGVLCGIVGICLNVLLFAGKFLAGTLSGSIAITADAFNNLSDAGSSFVTLVGFQLAGQKPDSEREDGVRLRPGGIGPDPADGPGAGEDVH